MDSIIVPGYVMQVTHLRAGGAWREAIQAGKRQVGVLTSVDWSKLPAYDLGENEMRMVETVMGPRFGYKPDILVLHSMPPECFDAWNDALKRCFRAFFVDPTAPVGRALILDIFFARRQARGAHAEPGLDLHGRSRADHTAAHVQMA